MANEQLVRDVLSRIAANYGRGRDWVEASTGDWCDALTPFTDRQVDAAVSACLTSEARCPTIATFRELVAASVKGQPTVRACAACGFTGSIPCRV